MHNLSLERFQRCKRWSWTTMRSRKFAPQAQDARLVDWCTAGSIQSFDHFFSSIHSFIGSNLAKIHLSKSLEENLFIGSLFCIHSSIQSGGKWEPCTFTHSFIGIQSGGSFIYRNPSIHQDPHSSGEKVGRETRNEYSSNEKTGKKYLNRSV